MPAAELPPNSYVRLYGARYREAWRLAEALRSRRGEDGFPDWPDWCYVPAWTWSATSWPKVGRRFRLNGLMIR